MKLRKSLVGLAAVVALAGCASQPPHPVLYPNAYFDKVGQVQAKADIAYCEALANQYIQTRPQAETVGKDTLVGGAAGGAIGAIGGAIAGDPGTGAAIGAATGVAGGLLYGLFEANEPPPTWSAFVERCLEKKGYDPIGWQ
ncbi:cell envelope biogenesis protein OmpA [Candidatus Binatia bacterium]|nr:cell envelope biogenesis protein OmpA [Candidatus Binatia bacterium]